jgi:Type III flagellar switch regulator (C-ring) FliN C-term
VNVPMILPVPDMPQLERGRALRQTALVAALRGRSLVDAPLEVALGDAGEASGWVICTSGIAIAPLVAEGQRLGFSADDGAPDAVSAIAALARLEPLLGLVETAIGAELLPAGLAVAAPDGVILALGCLAGRLLLAVPDDAAIAPAAGPAAIDVIMAEWQAEWKAARLRRWPARGDLLLGLGDAAVRLGNWRAPATLTQGGIGMTANWRTFMDDDAVAAPDAAALELPVTVRIAGAAMAVADLARLGPGAVLPLPGAPGQVVVTVLAGGAPIGTGTLVAIGDGYGVLFDRVFSGAGPP